MTSPTREAANSGLTASSIAQSEEWNGCDSNSCFNVGLRRTTQSGSACFATECQTCWDTDMRQANRFEVDTPIRCRGCDATIKIGKSAYECKACGKIYCQLCHLQMEVDTDLILMTMMQIPETPAPTKTPAAASEKAAPVSANEARSIAAIAATSNGLTLRSAGHGAGDLVMTLPAIGERMTEASQVEPSSQSQEGMKQEATTTSRGSNMKKQCIRCGSPYYGFGGACPPCRIEGPTGGARQCQTCSIFFHGFGDICVDCLVEDEPAEQDNG